MTPPDLHRRTFLKNAALTLSALPIPFASQAIAKPFLPTSSQIEGPFYPATIPNHVDFDLTRFEAKDPTASGKFIEVRGRVMNLVGKAVPGALVEIWQADTNGRYNHPRDRRGKDVDKNFQGYASVQTDAKGIYRFLTIKPGAYPIGGGISRPPHIHFKISYRDFQPLVTQMYFAGEALNKTDFILDSADRPKSLIVNFTKNKNASLLQGIFDIFIPVIV